ncbi:hypothetical protein DFH11DRAFT_1588063 [Phellopilus nigrolimitatus]|nr:hypothetical protein DFH11DRAFT_1588063 [Phellopilus nigrolimitatus]
MLLISFCIGTYSLIGTRAASPNEAGHHRFRIDIIHAARWESPRIQVKYLGAYLNWGEYSATWVSRLSVRDCFH